MCRDGDSLFFLFSYLFKMLSEKSLFFAKKKENSDKFASTVKYQLRPLILPFSHLVEHEIVKKVERTMCTVKKPYILCERCNAMDAL